MEDKQKLIDLIIKLAEKSILKETGTNCKLFAKTNIDLLSHSQIAHKIIEVCANEFGIEVSQMIQPSRKRTLVEPRQISMQLIRKHTLLALDEIGMFYMTVKKNKVIYGKDHTTIIHGIRAVDNLLEYDKRFADKYKNITETLNQLFY